MTDVIIREQRAEDQDAVEAAQAAAFGDHAVMVIPLLRSLQALPPSECALSLVGIIDGRVVGHALFSRSILDAPDRIIDVGVLSPIGVLPEFQSVGVGRSLVERGAEVLASRGVPAIFLEGSPVYYSRFGFIGGTAAGFRSPSLRIPDAGFQVKLLPAYEPTMTGTLVYDQVFWQHDAVGLRD